MLEFTTTARSGTDTSFGRDKTMAGDDKFGLYSLSLRYSQGFRCLPGNWKDEPRTRETGPRWKRVLRIFQIIPYKLG